MNKEKMVKIKPPLIVLALLTIAFILSIFFPLRRDFFARNVVVGAILLFAGFFQLLRAFVLFRKRATTILPCDPPKVFVQEGPYKYSRNPMYAAILWMTIGVALAAGTIWFYAVPVAMFFILNTVHIPFEEKNMEAVFGESYLNYKKKVRRWF